MVRGVCIVLAALVRFPLLFDLPKYLGVERGCSSDRVCTTRPARPEAVFRLSLSGNFVAHRAFFRLILLLNLHAICLVLSLSLHPFLPGLLSTRSCLTLVDDKTFPTLLLLLLLVLSLSSAYFFVVPFDDKHPRPSVPPGASATPREKGQARTASSSSSASSGSCASSSRTSSSAATAPSSRSGRPPPPSRPPSLRAPAPPTREAGAPPPRAATTPTTG